jgi:hypothetical protein
MTDISHSGASDAELLAVLDVVDHSFPPASSKTF